MIERLNFRIVDTAIALYLLVCCYPGHVVLLNNHLTWYGTFHRVGKTPSKFQNCLHRHIHLNSLPQKSLWKYQQALKTFSNADLLFSWVRIPCDFELGWPMRHCSLDNKGNIQICDAGWNARNSLLRFPIAIIPATASHQHILEACTFIRNLMFWSSKAHIIIGDRGTLDWIEGFNALSEGRRWYTYSLQGGERLESLVANRHRFSSLTQVPFFTQIVPPRRRGLRTTAAKGGIKPTFCL